LGARKIALAYEVGPTGFGLYDDLTAAGHRCLVVAPSMVPTAPGKRVKTNRLDSRKLSEGVRGAQLKSIHIPSGVYRQLRHLVQLRDSHVRQMTAAKHSEFPTVPTASAARLYKEKQKQTSRGP
jgi:transposase